MKNGKYIDLPDAARMLKVHPESLRKWVRQRLIQPADPGKPYVFSKEVVRNFKPNPVGRPRGIQFKGGD